VNYFKLRLRYGEYDINLIVSGDNHKALVFIFFYLMAFGLGRILKMSELILYASL